MFDVPTCSQRTKEGVCGKPAAVRFTWPGSAERYACAEHGRQAQGLANAMGFYLQLVEVEPQAGEKE